MSLSELVNPHIRGLAAYVPGKPIEEVERELGISHAVKLASNENPIGPSPKALEALARGLADVNRYPDGACFALRTRLAAHLSVRPNQIIFGCGGDEVLELLAKTFLSPGDEVVMPWPSFAMYPIVTQGMGATVVKVPLTDDFDHDLPAMAAAVTDRTKMVFVCNPNNPTGTSIGAGRMAEFIEALREDVVLVIDEAYYEFVRRVDFPDCIALLDRRPATLVLRTFSKIYGLAGLRVGYGIGSTELISFLERARHPFNVNRIAEAAALAAIDDVEHVARTRAVNAAGIEYLSRELPALGIRVWPSDANYILVEIGSGYADSLMREGVIVRPMSGFGLPDHIRISIGLPEENEKLVKAIARIQQRERTAKASR